MDTKSTPYFVVIFTLTLLVPILVLPGIVDNAFKIPKTVLITIGASLLLGIYSWGFLRGKKVRKAAGPAPVILLFLIGLNFFSFLYTRNYYFTIIAATLNVSCLLCFYFAALSLDGKRGSWVMGIAVFSGCLVSVIIHLQFNGHFLLFKWARPGMMVMGTIGNSNYLGAYLIFPLFAAAALIFLLRGKWRFVPVFLLIFMLGALLFTRARAGWFGFFFAFLIFLILIKKIHKIRLWRHLQSNLRQFVVYGIVFMTILVALWYAAPERFHVMMGFRNVTRSDTLRLRIQKYFHSSLWLIKQNPLFGTGLWSYRNLVYDAQAEINQTDPDYFKNYPKPKPRRVHNEYLEILNDGGLLAGAALALFFIVVMRHGWAVIRREDVPERDRIVEAAAFCAVIGMMLAALFFFPFRVNCTLFMTAVMMGLMEGIYLRNHGLLRDSKGWRSGTGSVLLPLVVLALIGVVWFTGIKPLQAERAHFKYKMALRQPREAERHLLRAIELDPHNSAYCFYAGQLYMNRLKAFGKAREYIERATIDFNGDITRWSVYFMKGLLTFQMGSLFEARAAFEKSLYYNPTFDLARQKLGEVNKILKDHDKVLIKFK